MEKMNNRVYGVVGIKSIMSNWNADFSGRCKTTTNGDIFGSDKAFKFPIKKMWEINGEKVLYIKSYDKDIMNFKTLKQRYEEMFGEIKKEELLKNLFSTLDVENFGATFTEGGNVSITGAVQIGQGLNKYKDANIQVQDILSPFRNPNNPTADQTSIGTKIMADEVHYMYPFSVNPQNYDVYTTAFPELTGYTKEAYEKFKKACLVAATAFNTNAKVGCENEFAVFVECKENSKVYFANLDQYITFEKGEELDTIDVTKLVEILENKIDEIENIEIYYNKYTTNLVGCSEHCNVKTLY